MIDNISRLLWRHFYLRVVMEMIPCYASKRSWISGAKSSRSAAELAGIYRVAVYEMRKDDRLKPRRIPRRLVNVFRW